MRNNSSHHKAALAELFPVEKGQRALSGFTMLDRTLIDVRPQVRSDADVEISSLRENISELKKKDQGIDGCGILQTLTVYKNPDAPGRYILQQGERRFRASEGILQELPCYVTQSNENASVLAQLVENTHRVSMNPLDEARALIRLRDDLGLSVRDSAYVMGQSKSWVSDRLALLKVAPDVRALVEQRPDTARAAREIDKVSDAPLRKKLIAQAAEGAPRRQIEAQIKATQVSARADTSPQEAPDTSVQNGTPAALPTTQGTGMSVGGGVSRETISESESAPQVLAAREEWPIGAVTAMRVALKNFQDAINDLENKKMPERADRLREILADIGRVLNE